MSSTPVPDIDFTPEDFNRSKILDQGWYRFKVKSIDYVANKEDSTKHNYLWEFVGTAGAALNVPVSRYFPDGPKSRGYMIPFMNACGAGITDAGKAATKVSNAVGKELELFIKPGEFGGNAKNDVSACRAVAGAKTA